MSYLPGQDESLPAAVGGAGVRPGQGGEEGEGGEEGGLATTLRLMHQPRQAI